MTSPPPPILPYHTPPPIAPNFGTRAAQASWVAPVMAIILFAIGTKLRFGHIIWYGGCLLWITGLVSGIAALASMRRYGVNGIRRRAIIGLCLLATMLFMLVVATIVGMCLGNPV